ncbi:hypothetical protein BT63DRAFT_425135 [Microthyrium microscopicum]|uniref:Protein FYV10 n=1 Tax=Microthyrium microscopicum TaxID=703497 RepID=A0A6A6UBW5_9PEZI|nr:hypothetical protein BT63DRAFT_425135 [Microthyrium microscopicum]
MAETSSIKLSPDTHVQLDQTLLRLPHELSRRTLRTANRHVEQTQTKVDDALKQAMRNTGGDGSKSLAAIDQAIARVKATQQKLQALEDTQQQLSHQMASRIAHVDELYRMNTLADVKYEKWSRTRLDRLIVDFMLRRGYNESAKTLAADRGIDQLVDIDEFENVAKIERSIRQDHRIDLALTWCGENKQTLKKFDIMFEYQLRLQQYIELIREGTDNKLFEATIHARKYLIGSLNTSPATGIESAGLLAFALSRDTDVEPYCGLFSESRWDTVADDFLEAHHKIFYLPLRPLLHIALTAGLSALKTPACHSKFVSPTSGLNQARSPSAAFDFSDTSMQTDDDNASMHNSATIDSIIDGDGTLFSAATALLNTPVCPICSTELNQLAKSVPFAHHSKSHVESDPVVLPNGRIYGRERLIAVNEKMGTPEGYVRDPMDPDAPSVQWSQVRKVFIS